MPSGLYHIKLWEAIDGSRNIVYTYTDGEIDGIEYGGGDVGTYNSFRYRGYYWDGEAGLYYLNTRWYDPETGRFISPDSINYLDPESINGLNLYAYCLNNPIMYTDPNGTTAWWEWLIGAVVVVGLVAGAVLTGGIVAAAFAGAAIGGAISYGTQAVSGELNWGQFALDIGVGAITGAIGASGLSKTAVTVLGGAIGSGSSMASDLINGKPVDWGKAAISGLIGVVAGYAGGAGVKNVRGLASSGKLFGASSNMPGIAAFLLKTSKTYLLTAQYKLFLGTMKYYTMGTIANNIVNIFM